MSLRFYVNYRLTRLFKIPAQPIPQKLPFFAQKDILRHSSTRRTITRFIATILIAVSIEALLLMFKSVLGSPEYLINAVAMMATYIGLLIGLGIYVYLGAKAEALLKSNNIRQLK